MEAFQKTGAGKKRGGVPGRGDGRLVSRVRCGRRRDAHHVFRFSFSPFCRGGVVSLLAVRLYIWIIEVPMDAKYHLPITRRWLALEAATPIVTSG